MNDIRRLKEQQKDKHPAFGSYLECMTRALFTGLASFSLSFAGLYFCQKATFSVLPIPPKYRILISSIGSCAVSYKVTSDRTKSCQAAWMAAENKHTALAD